MQSNWFTFYHKTISFLKRALHQIFFYTDRTPVVFLLYKKYIHRSFKVQLIITPKPLTLQPQNFPVFTLIQPNTKFPLIRPPNTTEHCFTNKRKFTTGNKEIIHLLREIIFYKSLVNLQKRVTENCFRLPAFKTNFDQIERNRPFEPNQKILTRKRFGSRSSWYE